MAVHILYNNLSDTAPLSGARRVAWRWLKLFERNGIEADMRELDVDTNNDIRMLTELEVDIRSHVYPNSLCHLIIFDDAVKGKYITNESEDLCYENAVSIFMSRDKKLKRREELYERVYQLLGY